MTVLADLIREAKLYDDQFYRDHGTHTLAGALAVELEQAQTREQALREALEVAGTVVEGYGNLWATDGCYYAAVAAIAALSGTGTGPSEYPPCPDCGRPAGTIYRPGEHRDYPDEAGNVYVCHRHATTVRWTAASASGTGTEETP